MRISILGFSRLNIEVTLEDIDRTRYKSISCHTRQQLVKIVHYLHLVSVVDPGESAPRQV